MLKFKLNFTRRIFFFTFPPYCTHTSNDFLLCKSLVKWFHKVLTDDVEASAGFHPADVVLQGDPVETGVFQGHLADLDDPQIVLLLDGEPPGGGENETVLVPSHPRNGMTGDGALEAHRRSLLHDLRPPTKTQAQTNTRVRNLISRSGRGGVALQKSNWCDSFSFIRMYIIYLSRPQLLATEL